MSILKQLLENDVITAVPGMITMNYKGCTVVPKLLNDGTLLWNKKIFSSASNFSLSFKQLINPALTSDNGLQSVLYNGIPLFTYVKLLKLDLAIADEKACMGT